MNLCDIETIKAVLGRHGFHFSKGLGQNFLTDASVPYDIAALSGVDAHCGCVEIGPGMGCLTRTLASVAKKVVAVELDRALFPVLEETVGDCENVEIVHGDVLKTDFKALTEEKLAGMPLHACANLPYYITSPAIAALLDSAVFESITVMVQKEVAQRICAAPGGKDYSAFSIYIQYHAQVSIVLDVPRECFVPQPKVDSAVIRIVPHKTRPFQPENQDLFFAMVKASFAQRRKTLTNGLGAALGGRFSKQEIIDLVAEAGFDEKIRGERLSVSDFVRLSDLANKKFKNKS